MSKKLTDAQIKKQFPGMSKGDRRLYQASKGLDFAVGVGHTLVGFTKNHLVVKRVK